MNEADVNNIEWWEFRYENKSELESNWILDDS